MGNCALHQGSLRPYATKSLRKVHIPTADSRGSLRATKASLSKWLSKWWEEHT